MFYRVQDVTPLADYRLQVRFMNGETKQYDVKPLFDEWEAFKALTHTAGLFEQVRVDAHGYGVCWNDDIDLECNELYERGIAVTA
ncbi:DUF2442 domain-containing protein [Treponema endosymbiont of Eucomonympha sp.]|uniref:DUF2442 domain-containing protein n=1 Tax=Treponema endosymbiont of Eucomonympha sp. TaxID=1580831 RepID=UPI000783C089|nr:DUF2442 domain-containing protein [Treponema endosymbiont of Eucomonympha sp.]